MAVRVVMDVAYWLAIGITTFVHTIDPDAIILGGAMTFGGNDTNVGRAFLATHPRRSPTPLPRTLRDTVKIEFASLGGDAGYIGAAGLARLEHQKQR